MAGPALALLGRPNSGCEVTTPYWIQESEKFMERLCWCQRVIGLMFLISEDSVLRLVSRVFNPRGSPSRDQFWTPPDYRGRPRVMLVDAPVNKKQCWEKVGSKRRNSDRPGPLSTYPKEAYPGVRIMPLCGRRSNQMGYQEKIDNMEKDLGAQVQHSRCAIRKIRRQLYRI